MQKTTIDKNILQQIIDLPVKDFMELLTTICSSCSQRPAQINDNQLMASILLGYATQLFEKSGCEVRIDIDNNQWENKRIQYISKGCQHERNPY